MTQTFNAAPAIAAIVPTVAKVINGQTYSATVAELPDSAVAYLVQYGFAQSIGDTAAISTLEKIKAAVKGNVFPASVLGTKESPLGTGDAAKVLAGLLSDPTVKANYDTFLATYLHERASERLADIISGSMTFGSSERLSPEEKDRRELTMEALKAALAKKGLKVPSEKDKLKAMLDYAYSQRQAHIEKEVTRRAKERSKVAPEGDEIDLSSFL